MTAAGARRGSTVAPDPPRRHPHSGAAGSDTPAATLLLAERFLSVQGEGPLTGQRCAFVRLSRCNLSCVWCDQPETWDRSRRTTPAFRAPVAELAAWIITSGVDLLVITGGEPLLQQPGLAVLLDLLPASIRVQVETNGTRIPEPALLARIGLWVVSPKPSNSGVPADRRIVPEAVTAFAALGRTSQRVRSSS